MRWVMVRTGQQTAEVGDRSPLATRELLDNLPAFEAACAAVEPNRLNEPEQSAQLLARWFDGVSLLDTISRVKSDASRPDRDGSAAEPRVVAAMTRVATAWLSPRFAGEPRIDCRKRIPSLRPVEQSLRLQELMGKNTEGTLTPDERGEFERLHEFFDTLQSILTEAVHATFPPKS